MNLPRVRAASVASWGAGAALISVIGVAIALGFEVAILALAGTVLVGVIALFWASVRNLSGETPLSIDEALGLGAPSAAEEEKRAVLRALKDLEFERSVGKISEQDYAEFSSRYRAEAKRLIAAVDQALGPVQELAEQLATQRLARAGLVDPPEPPLATKEEAKEAAEESPTSTAQNERRCASCQAENDADAAFCKRCGARLESSVPTAQAQPVEEEAP